MPSHPHSRASTAARSHIIETLLEDHRRLKRAYREFQHLDARRDATLCEALVRRTLQELRSAGLIVLKGKTLVVPNLGRLMNAGLFNANYLHMEREGSQLDANE